MSATIYRLENDGRFSPLKCLKTLVEDVEGGKRTPSRVIVVVEDETGAELDIRAAGSGMSYLPTVIGLLHLAIADLTKLASE